MQTYVCMNEYWYLLEIQFPLQICMPKANRNNRMLKKYMLSNWIITVLFFNQGSKYPASISYTVCLPNLENDLCNTVLSVYNINVTKVETCLLEKHLFIEKWGDITYTQEVYILVCCWVGWTGRGGQRPTSGVDRAEEGVQTFLLYSSGKLSRELSELIRWAGGLLVLWVEQNKCAALMVFSAEEQWQESGF